MQFLLSSPGGAIPFTINAQNGSISTSEPLDREDRGSFEFTAVVADAGDASVLFGLVRILVTVADRNDNSPVFPDGDGTSGGVFNKDFDIIFVLGTVAVLGLCCDCAENVL